MPDLIQGVKDIVDKYDEPPEPSTSENGEGEGLEGSLNLEGARGELEAFREEAFHGIGGEQTFLDVSALFTRSVNSWFSPFSGIQKRDQGAGCREAAALKNSKK